MGASAVDVDINRADGSMCGDGCLVRTSCALLLQIASDAAGLAAHLVDIAVGITRDE